ncbi:MAG TPA: ATP-binding protein [Chloroflexota bacterium]|nr:ATP-binding protein [Chloroflexota bacterium]
MTASTCAPAFPPTLLHASAAGRIEYFNSLWVAHPALDDALKRVRRLLRLRQPDRLIVLNGPTGDGKTRLCQMILSECLDSARDRIATEMDYVPAFMVELAANHDGRFDWRDHFQRSLTQLEEPLVDRKVLPNRLTGNLEWGTERVLRQAYENCLRYRKVDLAIWDEAHHLRKVAGSRAFVEQMDTVKSIANLTGTLHLLAGTYELLDLCDLSAELARRAYDVHLPRYGEWAHEQKIFGNVVRSLQLHIPLGAQADLSPLADYLYERSLGCVGILKDWLLEAVAFAIEEDAVTLSEQHLRQTGYSAGKLTAIQREIEAGEWRRREMDGLAPRPSSVHPAPAHPTGFRRKPGQRLPHRDPVPVA